MHAGTRLDFSFFSLGLHLGDGTAHPQDGLFLLSCPSLETTSKIYLVDCLLDDSRSYQVDSQINQREAPQPGDLNKN